MKKVTKKDWLLFLAQAGVWALMMLVLPLATFISTRNWETTFTSFIMVWQQLRAPLAVNVHPECFEVVYIIRYGLSCSVESVFRKIIGNVFDGCRMLNIGIVPQILKD